MTDTAAKIEPRTSGRALRTYLLGTLEFETFLALQRRLLYDTSGDRSAGSLIVCDHPPGITIGREGSRAHVRPGPGDLRARGWPLRWVGRGGGALLHLPGQVACYPILPLDTIGLTITEYVRELQEVVIEMLRDYRLVMITDPDRPGVRINGRCLAHVGIAVRDNVTAFGLILNVDPDLEPFRDVRCNGDSFPMTSLQREAAGRIRVPGVRQRLVELIAARFGFDRVSVFHAHPSALSQATRHAAAQRT